MNTILLTGRQVVFTMLYFGCNLLWDECYRMEYLNSARKVQLKQGFEVYGFSVFSDRVCMVTGKFGEYTEKDACYDQLMVLNHFLKHGDLSDFDLRQYEKSSGPRTECRILDSADDIRKTVIYIHLLAQDLGYIRIGTRYWWSSYQTYCRRYSWNIVDTAYVLDSISSDRDHAQRVFARQHGQAGKLGNPKPPCLNICNKFEKCFLIQLQCQMTNSGNDGMIV